jgi:hypothetical protein
VRKLQRKMWPKRGSNKEWKYKINVESREEGTEKK